MGDFQGSRHITEKVAWAIMGIALAAVVPFARVPGPEAPGVPAIFSAAITVVDAATAFLLMARFMEARSTSILLLGTTYLYSAILTTMMLLVFPDVVVRGGSVLLPGKVGNQGISWIFQIWFWGFAIMTFAASAAAAYAPSWKITPPLVFHKIIVSVTATISLALGLSLLVLVFADELPLMMVDFQWTTFNSAATAGGYVFLLGAILIIQFRLRGEDPLFRWLQLALTIFALANALTTASGGRYTIGWTAGRIFWAASACVMLIYFLVQYGKQQKALAEARDNLEKAVLARTGENDQLIRVINHRIGNQLQVIQSMVSIEKRMAESEESNAILDRLSSQLETMALEHVDQSRSDYLDHGVGEKDGTITPGPTPS